MFFYSLFFSYYFRLGLAFFLFRFYKIWTVSLYNVKFLLFYDVDWLVIIYRTAWRCERFVSEIYFLCHQSGLKAVNSYLTTIYGSGFFLAEKTFIILFHLFKPAAPRGSLLLFTILKSKHFLLHSFLLSLSYKGTVNEFFKTSQ